MKNISFDNPLLLLAFLPIVAILVLSFLFTSSKDNKSLAWKISLALHVVIAALASLALAGIMSVSVLTQTTIYVVADVSYSSERNYEEIDGYIAEIKKELPANTKLGVICFGEKSVELVEPGKKIKSVSEAKLDVVGTSKTNIASALTYAGSRFKMNTIKRVILITDGNDTVNKQVGDIASAVEILTSAGVKVDAIFLNNALKAEENEVQISSASLTESLYLDHENEVKFLVQSTTETNAKITLYYREYGETEYKKLDETDNKVLEEGFNTVTMALPKDEEGVFEFKAELTAEKDYSLHNNVTYFTQMVEGKLKVLHLTGSTSDKDYLQEVYGDAAVVETYLIKSVDNFDWISKEGKTIKCKGRYFGENCGYVYSFSQETYEQYMNGTKKEKEAAKLLMQCPQCEELPTVRVPYSIEEMAGYDEIVISSLDVRNVKNANAFLDALDVVVSQYGKGLFTFGDLKTYESKDNSILTKFAEMLPVKYGIANKEGQLYTIAIDRSGSMNYASKFFNAQKAAIQLLELLGEEDKVCVIEFEESVTASPVYYATKENKTKLKEDIQKMKPSGNTNINGSIAEALKEIKNAGMQENNVMIISDGLSGGNEAERNGYIKAITDLGGVVSCINTYYGPGSDPNREGQRLMQSIATVGDGKLYVVQSERDIHRIIFGDVVSDMTEPIVYKPTYTIIEDYNETIMNGFTSLPNVSTYIKSVETPGAVVCAQLSNEEAFDGKVPLYAYRQHGNGKVSTFATSLGNWTKEWSDDQLDRFFNNALLDATPTKKVDYPFTLTVTNTNFETNVEVRPSVSQLHSKTTLDVEFWEAGTNAYTKKSYNMAKGSGVYTYTYDSGAIGVYKIIVTYHYSYQRTEGEDNNDAEYEEVHTAEWFINRSYLPEYNAFESFDSAKIYDFMRGNGSIYIKEIPNLEHNKGEITTSMVSYRIPLLLTAIVLFLADIVIRKIRFKDKRFKKMEKEKEEKRKAQKGGEA